LWRGPGPRAPLEDRVQRVRPLGKQGYLAASVSKHDSDAFPVPLDCQGSLPVIPSNRSRAGKLAYDKQLYKSRSEIPAAPAARACLARATNPGLPAPNTADDNLRTRRARARARARLGIDHLYCSKAAGAYARGIAGAKSRRGRLGPESS
jgi:hypothetical protein